jgi:hypothetical protein
VKPQRVRYKLVKTIEQPCSDVLAHTPEVCKGTRPYNECKTVITAVLTVMSDMDPHMISGTWDGFGLV